MSLIRRRTRRGFPRTRHFLGRFRKSTEASVTQGNLVELFPDGGAFFPSFFASLQTAQRTISLEFYIIRDDAIGQQMAELLVDAVRRGVTVSLLYDYIGSFETMSAFFRRLEEAGVTCRAFNPPPFRRGLGWFDKRDHRKIAVIDGTMAFAGGMNIGDEYAGFGEDRQRWRDVGIRITGPAVLELQRLFCENWADETGANPAGCDRIPSRLPQGGDATVHIVSGGPHHTRSFIRNAFRLAIAGASRSITIANPYFVPGPRLIRSLLRASRRGVRIRLILPAVNDVPLVRLVSRSTYSSLLRAGIEIYEREGTVLHAKVMSIDGCWSIIGSANLDQRSFHRNFEVNLIVDSRAFGCQVDVMLGMDLAKSKRVILEEHERRGWLIRMLERLCSPISWFL
ncbi:MAG: cardiolipin synthase [Geobacter sp.]|nr:cardiolipin synthase [Geobacter sp.]